MSQKHKVTFIMITWMQRHKKWLIITIWISTISFIGSGVVMNWDDFGKGGSNGAVAKVGDVEISGGELNREYSKLYMQYSQLFQGQFDTQKAKEFGLEAQALKKLEVDALILNLAKLYDLQVTDVELFNEIKKQPYFAGEDGYFSKEVYKQVLSKNRLSVKEYEQDLRKELLKRKTLLLLAVKDSEAEKDVVKTVLSIADKIEYKVLDAEDVKVDSSDKVLKPFWEKQKQNFKTETTYELEYIVQPSSTKTFSEAEISKYYNENRRHFLDDENKILPLEKAKDLVVAELQNKETKNLAKRTYIYYKKGKKIDMTPSKTVISNTNNPYSEDIFAKISKTTLSSPFIKPVLFDGKYIIFKLVKITPSRVKTYEEAKPEVLALFLVDAKQKQLLKKAQESVKTFKGDVTDFITRVDSSKVTLLNNQDAEIFLARLFQSKDKESFIDLQNGKIVLYRILEQKLLDNPNSDMNYSLIKYKSAIFEQALLKALQDKYKTEIYIKGL